jgi:hypothetical protein
MAHVILTLAKSRAQGTGEESLLYRATRARGRLLDLPPRAQSQPRPASTRCRVAIIGRVRRNPSTVVVLAGRPSEQVLAAVGRSLNVVLVRPESPASGTAGGAEAAGIEGAAGALRRAGGVSAAYVLVAADPLASLAAAWEAMWSLTAESHGSDDFELRAAEALGAWRAKRFELPDYYLVLAEETAAGRAGAAEPGGAPGAGGAPAANAASGAGEPRADFYLGPLRAVRPNRVAVAAGATPAAQADALLSELGSLRHGPWWPSLEEIVATARGFYPGTLAESPAAGSASLLA